MDSIRSNDLRPEPQSTRMNSKSAVIVCALLALLPSLTMAQSGNLIEAMNTAGEERLVVDTAGGLVAAGTANVGVLPMTGAGTRMMWYPAKWAFRAGQLDGSGATYWDDSSIGEGSVAFGRNVRAEGANSFAVGLSARAAGDESVALGGNGVATGEDAIALGSNAQASGDGSVAVGWGSTASGLGSFAVGSSLADGAYAIVIGGQSRASGAYSVAIGRNARTSNRTGAVVIGDACAGFNSDSVYPTANNQVVMRGCGGFRFYTSQNLSSGVVLPPGGSSWSSVSDVNRKENFEGFGGEDVLTRLRDVPVMTWNYLAQDASIRHAGPTAQDFHAAFGLGESDLRINTIDMDGVLLAAVKALDERTRERDDARAEVDALRATLSAHAERLAELERSQAALIERLEALERHP